MKKLLLILLIGMQINAHAQNPCTHPVINVSGKAWVCRSDKDTLTVSGPNGTTYLWDNGGTSTTNIIGPITADSVIIVTGTNGGCSTTDTFYITLRRPPVINITPPILLCAGSLVTLTANASGTGPFTYTWSPGGETTDTIDVSPISPTTYTVTVSNGCKSSKQTIVMPYNPNISACCNYTIHAGQDTILSAVGIDMRNYNWQPSAGVICLNILCDSVRVTPVVTTTYTVTCTDSLGCQAERTLTVTVGPAAFPSISAMGFINVYPNPSSTSFTIKLPVKTQINVCDITGRLLLSEMENAGTITFGKELNPGMYFLFIDGKPAVKLLKL